jgi:hypothetical protein
VSSRRRTAATGCRCERGRNIQTVVRERENGVPVLLDDPVRLVAALIAVLDDSAQARLAEGVRLSSASRICGRLSVRKHPRMRSPGSKVPSVDE